MSGHEAMHHTPDSNAHPELLHSFFPCATFLKTHRGNSDSHLFSADVSPPLQTLNGTIDRVDEYDTSLFQPAHPELEEYDEEEGGFIYNNVTYHYFISISSFY
jgi:hypothetical protein